jgi:hypothetical protein
LLIFQGVDVVVELRDGGGVDIGQAAAFDDQLALVSKGLGVFLHLDTDLSHDLIGAVLFFGPFFLVFRA